MRLLQPPNQTVKVRGALLAPPSDKPSQKSQPAPEPDESSETRRNS